jgi:hypothetical protein
MQALPFLFAVGLGWVALAGASHLLFNVADSTGAFCRETPKEQQKPVNLGTPQAVQQVFSTNAFCFATGLTVRTGYHYEVAATVREPWFDGHIPAGPSGYETSETPIWSRALLYPGIILRRIIFRPWFRLIARVGATGVDEYFLDVERTNRANSRTTVYKASFTAEHDGEVFLYVNDASLAPPRWHSYFYDNNTGTADITIRLK